MKDHRLSLRSLAATTLLFHLLLGARSPAGDPPAATPAAATVIDYHPGAGANLTNPYAAVGEPGGLVGAGTGFDSIYSPFNPHYEAHELAQIGEGGDLTLRLGCRVNVAPGAAEIGLFTNVGLIDGDFPNGLNNVGAFGADAVVVEVSADGLSWTSLGSVTCDFPGNAFSDAPAPFLESASGLSAAEFSRPHQLQLADLDGKTHAQILALLGGSAGGNWIDLDPSGLASVSYLRLSVPDDGDAGTQNSFELAGVAVNASLAAPPSPVLTFTEDLATDPRGGRASSDAGHASYAPGALTVSYDLAAPTARTAWQLGQVLTDGDSFSYTVEFTIRSIGFDSTNFGQLSFGLINAGTTGGRRTSVPSDAWDLLTVDYFPNDDFTTLAPTVIGSQLPGQGNAFDRLGFPAGSASLINEFDEVGQLPVGVPLRATLDYAAAARTVTLRLDGQAINAWGPDPDGDPATIEYIIPAGISFAVDSFAIVCWQEASGGTATVEFRRITVTTPSPPANYYSWADANIAAPLGRATGLDADGDGLANLIDYALGGAPPTSSLGRGGLALLWREIAARGDVVLSAEASADLRTWAGVRDTVVSSGPGTETHQATLSLGGANQFLRLRAVRP